MKITFQEFVRDQIVRALGPATVISPREVVRTADGRPVTGIGATAYVKAIEKSFQDHTSDALAEFRLVNEKGEVRVYEVRVKQVQA